MTTTDDPIHPIWHDPRVVFAKKLFEFERLAHVGPGSALGDAARRRCALAMRARFPEAHIVELKSALLLAWCDDDGDDDTASA